MCADGGGICKHAWTCTVGSASTPAMVTSSASLVSAKNNGLLWLLNLSCSCGAFSPRIPCEASSSSRGLRGGTLQKVRCYCKDRSAASSITLRAISSSVSRPVHHFPVQWTVGIMNCTAATITKVERTTLAKFCTWGMHSLRHASGPEALPFQRLQRILPFSREVGRKGKPGGVPIAIQHA